MQKQITQCTRGIYVPIENMKMYIPTTATDTNWTICQVCINLGCHNKMGIEIRELQQSDIADPLWDGGAFCDCSQEHEYVMINYCSNHNINEKNKCQECGFISTGVICCRCAYFSDRCICNKRLHDIIKTHIDTLLNGSSFHREKQIAYSILKNIFKDKWEKLWKDILFYRNNKCDQEEQNKFISNYIEILKISE